MNLKDELPNFEGRVLSVLCQHENTSQLLADVVFKKYAGRVFLVGNVPEQASQDNWTANLPSAIAWDSVQDYVIFDSVSDYQKRLNRKPKKKRKQKK